MDPAKKLGKIRKSLEKARGVCEKLEKKAQKIQIKICDSEKEKARQGRVKFVNNIQLSKVPSLLKRRLPLDEDNTEEAAQLRDSVFGISDLLTQITEHLGPTEYFMFSRTSKTLALALTDSLDVWGKLFLARMHTETTNTASYKVREKTVWTPLIEKFQKFKQKKETALVLLPMVLSAFQKMFVEYRPHRNIINSSFDVYGTGSYTNGDLEDAHVFVQNRATNQLCRASEYNLLFSAHSSKEVGRAVETRFYLKHGFPLIRNEEDKKVVPLDYFNYQDLNALNLDRREKRSNCNHGAFMIDPLSAQISEWSDDSKQFRLHVLPQPYNLSGNKKGKLFCDEYECYSAILDARNKFKPKYISTPEVFDFMNTLSASVQK